MARFIPITLSGNSLGERHRQLNSLVNDAYKSSISFQLIQQAPEFTPIDRLFKIDLASKHKDVDYILKNFKNADMLYVSRALKCTWLLDPQYSDIINPNYLEDELFPEMTTPAINKMKHWIHDHLQDPERCQIFYERYKNNDFQLAMKFLRYCTNEYLLEEFKTIQTRVTPKQLKVFSEKCPQLTKIFYEQIKHDKDLLKHYLDSEGSFLKNLKYLLKPDPETFFDILEKYYNVKSNGSFRSDITQHIMLYHRDKFFKKPELYTVHFLNINTLAKCLSPEEAKNLVQKLAHAAYLDNWFTYKNVEPLILRLDKDARVVLKKVIFVNKELGVKIKDWPYALPTSPILDQEPGHSLFLDKVHHICDYDKRDDSIYLECCDDASWVSYELKLEKVDDCYFKQKTLLDELFDRYRFSTFESTFYELRTRMRLESLPQNRQFMVLVLVSKSGGRENSLRTLFGLLSQYKNEPVHWRAAIVRSLVKRAFAWRLPEDLWSNLLEWAQGLGLDGSEPEAACDEGLHAVVMRDLLANETPQPSVLNSFYNHFSYFTEYSLTSFERSFLRKSLLNLLIAASEKETTYEKIKRLNQVLNALQAYKVPYSEFPSIITAIVTAAQTDPESYRNVLLRLFVARAGRRHLFKANFLLIQNNASYMNALRHDITVLDAEKFVNLHSNQGFQYRKLRFEFNQFLKKVRTYFLEDGGLAKEFYAVLKEEAERNPRKLLGRPLALLAGDDLPALVETFDNDTKRRLNSAKQSLSAALRANGHVSRPPIDLNGMGWETAGVKAVANMVFRRPKKEREEIVANLMNWKQALRLALALSVSEGTILEIFKSLIALRPGAAVKAFLKYLNTDKLGDSSYLIWHKIKPLITALDYDKRDRLCNKLANISMPKDIRCEYYVLVYEVYMKKDERKALPILCLIVNICSEIDESFFYKIIKPFLEHYFIAEKIFDNYSNYNLYQSTKCVVYVRIIAKFMLLCTSEEIQKKRLETVGEPFFALFENMWRTPSNRNHLDKFLFEFLTTLKYNKVIFDSSYVSCMPVFERVESWMQSMLSIEKWFDLFVDIRLTMLYHEAARHCIKQKPEYFKTDSTSLDKGIEMFGTVFGTMVAHEFEELNCKFFPSIKEMYKKELIDYFVKNVDYQIYDESKEKFAIAFIKSVLVESKTKEAQLIAFHIFHEHVLFYFDYGYDLSDIINLLKETKNNELRFNFEAMITEDAEGCNKIKSYLDTAMV